jgi:hypothetical protein
MAFKKSSVDTPSSDSSDDDIETSSVVSSVVSTTSCGSGTFALRILRKPFLSVDSFLDDSFFVLELLRLPFFKPVVGLVGSIRSSTFALSISVTLLTTFIMAEQRMVFYFRNSTSVLV